MKDIIEVCAYGRFEVEQTEGDDTGAWVHAEFDRYKKDGSTKRKPKRVSMYLYNDEVKALRKALKK